MRVVHAGFPIGTGSSSFQIKFEFRNDETIIEQEADELARIISALTWLDVKWVGFDSKGRPIYRFTQGDGTRIKVEVRDLISINLMNGDIILQKGGALYQEGSSSVIPVRLGSLYSFLDDEVFYTVQLISVLSRVELMYSKSVKGVVSYFCAKKILYANFDESSSQEGCASSAAE